MVRDMTDGKPLKLILSFCVPLLFGNIFQQMYNMVDTVIVGKTLGSDSLAAVGLTGSLSFLVLGFVLGICSGFCIPVAQKFGGGNHSEMRRYIANAFYLCCVVTVVLTALTMCFTRQLLVIMQTPAEIIDEAYSYIIVIFAGIVSAMFYNLLSGILRSLGDSRTPLMFLIVSSILNVILDIVLIVFVKLGVSGAAYATVISQATSGILCFIYIKRRYEILEFQGDELRFDGRICCRLLSIGVPMALQFSITAVGSIILQTAVNSLGTGVIAAVTAANKIQMLVTQPMETIGITMATFSGQNLGAGRIDRVDKGIKQALTLSVCYCIAACVLMWFFGGKIGYLFIDKGDEAILGDVAMFLRWNSIFYPVLGVLFILRNSLQGLGYSLLPMTAGVFELVARAFVSFVFVGVAGYTAICLAAPIAWLAADLLLVTTYVVKIHGLKKYGMVRAKLSPA